MTAVPDVPTIAIPTPPTTGERPDGLVGSDKRPQAITEFYRRALNAPDETALYRTIATWLPELLAVDRASIALLIEPDDGTEPYLEVLGLSGTSGALPRGRRLSLSGSRSGLAMRDHTTQRWRLSDNLDQWEAANHLASTDLEGVMNAPLIVNGEAVGSLNVARRLAPFDEPEADVLTEVAAIVATNLDRFQALARTRNELADSRRQLRHLEFLGRLGRSLAMAHTTDEVLALLATIIGEVVPADQITLALTDPERGRYRIARLEPDRRSGSSTSGLRTEAEADIDNSRLAAAVRSKQLVVEQHPSSVMTIPIRIAGRVAAVITCAAADDDHYRQEHTMTAEAVALAAEETLERIRATEEVAARDRQLATIVDESPLLTMSVDPAGTLIQVSAFGARRLGHEPAAIAQQPLTVLYPDDQHDLVRHHLDALLAETAGAVVDWDAAMITADGDRRWVHHTARRLIDDNESSHASILIVCEDVSELVEMTARLEYEASHDPLTGLVNRREFDRRLTEVTGAGTAGALLYIDVDQFKIVNDTAGHKAGDALLVELSTMLRVQLQKDDVIGRLGGDEFAIMLPGCSLANAVRVGERLRRATHEMVFESNGRAFAVSLSIGVVAIPECPGDDRISTEEVMGRADVACYAAKRDGRNRVSVGVAERVDDPNKRPDGQWGSRLREAVGNGDLELLAQPIVRVGDDDGLARAEMLIRMREPDGTLLAAGAFVPSAERLGLIPLLDRWVVTSVADLLSANRDRLDNLDFLAVNLSPRSMESDGFLDHLLATLARPGVDPTKLLFEVTETAALSNFNKAVRFIGTASAVGCRFALDDFGAGFSTFHYLKRLPVDVLKIDGSLIKDLTAGSVDASIVESIASVAKALGMDTIAEFVENETIMDTLRPLGVTFGQGYAIGRPAPVEESVPGFVLTDRRQSG